MVEEKWKTIEYFPNYEVSDQGRVRNKITGLNLKPGLGGVGYLTVALYKDKNSTTKNIHQLVSDAFIGKPDRPNMTVNHIDGNKQNNTLSNLELVSRRENNIHAYKTGLNPHKKAIRIVETGEIFDSQYDCAKAIDGDPSNISNCLSGKLNSHKGLHFESIDKSELPSKIKDPFLYPHQRDAISRMRNGCILNGGVGSGKSRTGLYYYFSRFGGYKEDDEYIPMKEPKDLYIITTAKKRDSLDWEGEMGPFLLSTNPEFNYYKNKVVVDSWNNIKKYIDVKDAFFIFDEDRVTGTGVWVKSFLKIVKSNEWIILSATAGDSWVEYAPVFVANGFYRSIYHFEQEHVIYNRFVKYKQVDRYYAIGKLTRLRESILIDMDFERPTVPHHEDVYVRYDVSKYKDIMRNRWDPYENKPIKNASRLCYLLRKVVNTDESRIVALLEILERTPRAIIFYNFDHELDILKNLTYGEGVEIAEWNGHAHQPIPDSKKWVYLVQYGACEGWNCIKTDTIIFYSQNYSYKTMVQAAGRIDRLNTTYKDLYYYHLKSRSGIDLAISKALAAKKKFNASRFVKW